MLGFNGGLLGKQRVPTTAGTSGLWFPDEQNVAMREAIWPAGIGIDPNFSSVSLLLHMDGSNGSTTFTDGSLNALTVTANGNAQISTTQQKFGTACGLFDGSGDYLSLAASALFDVGSGIAFTAECFVRRNVNGIGGNIFSQRILFTDKAPFEVNFNGSGQVSWLVANAAVSSWAYNQTSASSNIIAFNTWHHVALVGTGSTISLYVDGVSIFSGAQPSWTSANRSLYIGSGGGEPLNGRIDEFRFTKGVARYTANFTPPNTPFPSA